MSELVHPGRVRARRVRRSSVRGSARSARFAPAPAGAPSSRAGRPVSFTTRAARTVR